MRKTNNPYTPKVAGEAAADAAITRTFRAAGKT